MGFLNCRPRWTSWGVASRSPLGCFVWSSNFSELDWSGQGSAWLPTENQPKQGQVTWGLLPPTLQAWEGERPCPQTPPEWVEGGWDGLGQGLERREEPIFLSACLSVSLSHTHISPKSLIYKSFHDSTSHSGITFFHFFVGSYWLFSDWKRSILNCIFPVSGQNSFPSKSLSHAHTGPSASSKLNKLILCRTLHLLPILSPFLSSCLPIYVKHFMILHSCP